MTTDKTSSNEEEVTIDHQVASQTKHEQDSYEGRKHETDIDGPQQDSQETDEIYADPRKEEDLPAGGKNVADLNVHNLNQQN